MCRSKTHKIGGKKGETQQIDVGLSSMVLTLELDSRRLLWVFEHALIWVLKVKQKQNVFGLYNEFPTVLEIE